jgi:hypothetical protein
MGSSKAPATSEGLAPLSAAALAQLRAEQLPRLAYGAVAFVHDKQREQLPAPDAFLASVRQLLMLGAGDALRCVQVRRVPPGHAAAPGCGLFATAALAAHTVLAEYGGELLTDAECRERDPLPDGSRNACIFGVALSLEAEMDIDGASEPRAVASYVNDHKGGVGQPNTRFMEVLCGGGCACKGGRGRQPGVVHPHLIMLTGAAVAAGDELLTRYGAGYWRVHAPSARALRAARRKPGEAVP